MKNLIVSVVQSCGRAVLQFGRTILLPSRGAERKKMIQRIILAKEPDCRVALWWMGRGWVKIVLKF